MLRFIVVLRQGVLQGVLPAMLLVALLVAPQVAPAQAQRFQSVSPEEATLIQEGQAKLHCHSCGMNLVTFYKTSHTLAGLQFCSLHCLVDGREDLTGAQVVDNTTLKLIPAKTAFYVVGSDAPGTMSTVSQYAFGTPTAARSFMAEQGGQLMTFTQAAQLARESLSAEKVQMTQRRRAASEKGARIFKTMCPDIQLPTFATLAEAQSYLTTHHPCGDLNDGQHQALAIYLVSGNLGPDIEALKAPADARCPVCGMRPALYPNWLAAIETTDGRTFYFDGVKDMMKFSYEPQRYHETVALEDVKRMLVTDYYDLGRIDAREAWYVVGSNVFGPMGHELIPFRSKADAVTFSQDHINQDHINPVHKIQDHQIQDHQIQGVIPFSMITPEVVSGLDR